MRVGFARLTKIGVTTFQDVCCLLFVFTLKVSHAQGSITIAGSEVWVANKWSHIRNGKLQVFRSSLNVFTVFFQPITYFLLTWGHWLERCAKTSKPKRLTKPVSLCITIGRLQEPMNNYHSDALFAFANLMPFRASCSSIVINDFNVTKKSKFMKQSETFSLRSFFEQIHLMTVIWSHISLNCSSSNYSLSAVNLFQFSYLKRKGSHIKNLSDGIEGFYFS